MLATNATVSSSEETFLKDDGFRSLENIDETIPTQSDEEVRAVHKMVDFDTYNIKMRKLNFLTGLVFFSTFSAVWDTSQDDIYAKHFGWDQNGILSYIRIVGVTVGILISSFLLGKGR